MNESCIGNIIKYFVLTLDNKNKFFEQRFCSCQKIITKISQYLLTKSDYVIHD